MAKITKNTVASLSAAYALAITAVDAAIAKRDELYAELESAKLAEKIEPGWVVTFSTGRAETRVLRFGTVRLVDSETGRCKVEVGEGFDAQYFVVDSATLFSSGPAETGNDVIDRGTDAFEAAVEASRARLAKATKAEAEAAGVVEVTTS